VEVRVSATPCNDQMLPLPEAAEVIGDPNCRQHVAEHATQILVEDNGSGIAAEQLRRVFEPFYTSREPGHGMGLGLYLVQEIIQEHDGCIAIASREHEGTQVFVRLPCVSGDPA
jgi:signal transduction histidine kinase